MTNLITDLSTVTTIPESALSRLCEKCENIISYSVYESMQDSEQVVSVDIGIGILYINIQEDIIEYKFVPSSNLEQKVLQTSEGKYKPLIGEVEKTLKNRILSVYKELF